MQIFFDKFELAVIPFLVFVVMYFIDFILGVLKGWRIEGISSDKMKASVTKFIACTACMLMAVLVDGLADFATVKLNMVHKIFDGYAPISLLLIIMFCLIEAISILENAQILGVKIPKFALKIFQFFNIVIFNDESEEVEK